MGSNKNRAKLNHIPALQLPLSRVKEPIIKGRNYKKRGEKIDKNRQSSGKSHGDLTYAFGEKGVKRQLEVQLDKKSNYE